MFEVEFTDEFEEWWHALDEDEQESCFHSMRLLQEQGPALSRPHADTLKGSRYPNLKELRVQHAGDAYRLFYIFDPRRIGMLLIGGIKQDKAFYRDYLPRAERIYAQLLRELQEEGLV